MGAAPLCSTRCDRDSLRWPIDFDLALCQLIPASYRRFDSFDFSLIFTPAISLGFCFGEVERLNNFGFRLKDDGFFGKQTEAAVKEFQGRSQCAISKPDGRYMNN
jgi:hypothetical protein